MILSVLLFSCASCGKKTQVEDLYSESLLNNSDAAISDSSSEIAGTGSTAASGSTAGTSGAASAGTGTGSGSTKKATITMAHWMAGGTTEKTSVNMVIQQLEKDYPNLTVKINFISGDYSTKMYANLAAGKEPDVFMVADGDFGKWVKAGVLENLSPYVKNSKVVDPAKIWSSAITRYSYNGTSQGTGDLYVMPKDISPRVLFYNKDLLTKYGVAEPSKTKAMSYEEFVSFLTKVTHPADGVWGIPQLNWEGWIRSYGTSLLSSNYKTSNLNDKTLQDVFQKMSDLIHVYKVIPSSTQLDSSGALIMFQTQKSACYDGAIYNVISVRDVAFDWDICPLPGGAASPYATGYTGSVGYGVSKNSKNKNEAYLVAEYFSGRKAQQLLSEIGFNIPLYKDMANSSVFLNTSKKPSNMSAFLTAAEYQQPLDSVFTDNDQWYTVLGNRLQPLWNDPSVKASVLLPSIKSEIDSLLK